ncbi:MAG: hypothetical protein HLUCCX14_08835 [Marinobacter excellens HL-55]|uniref:Uncharacterized protein n=1 Tax=Marinobacter excellens HL-55 TaxID=1305731 RepID=A0A0N8KKQ5_9GAMM|nr:MAG: hypothetical protein HLUCCX14_08835 [Marinobacter excellens HL-55]
MGYMDMLTKFFVSIHAPARGATLSLSLPRQSHDSFNPRAREGRDVLICSPAPNPSKFQSTRPRGARRNHTVYFPTWSYVSIHAPARGATDWGVLDERRVKVSIHAPARGATAYVARYCMKKVFQSTRPRGARLFPVMHRFHLIGFNPRAREGRDVVHQIVSTERKCFNPRAREGRDNLLRPRHQ